MLDALTFKARMILLAVAAAALLACGAAIGATIQYWRLNSQFGDERMEHAKAIAALTKTITEQQSQIQMQDAANALLTQQSESADVARQQAEKHAQDMAELSRSRVEKIQALPSKDCADVLSRYWEMRK